MPLTQQGCLNAPQTAPRTASAQAGATTVLAGSKRGGTATPGDGSASPMPAGSDGGNASGGGGAVALALPLAAVAAANSAKRQRTAVSAEQPFLEQLQGMSEAQLWSVAASALQVCGGACRAGLRGAAWLPTAQ